MDRLLTSVRSRSWLLLLHPTRHFSSFNASSYELRSQALLHLVRQFESSKQKSFVPSLPDFHAAQELNYRFPLPGCVGLFERKPHESPSAFLDELIRTRPSPTVPSKAEEEPTSSIDFCSHDCSLAIRSELHTLFLNYDATTQPFTAIMVAFPTKLDMSAWSPEVEAERKQLAEQFTTMAQQISTHLADQNYWVDFIDPANGKPFYGPPTSDALFETDERLRHFGIETVDLGCCRVVEHLQYGTNVFIGCIFTSAPKTDPEVQQLLDEFAAAHCEEDN